jgi:hypothetical protein
MNQVEVLFFAADPKSVPSGRRLLIDEEVRQIEAKVRGARYRQHLRLDTRWAARTDDLLQALNETRPRVVHFSGHGGEEGLVLVSADGKRERHVDAPSLQRFFRVFAGDIRVVVLNACFSLPQAEAIADVVGCAVGTPSTIKDEDAILFAGSFYRALAFGNSVGAAFDQGCSALDLEQVGEGEWPRLVARPGVDPANLFLFAPPPLDEPRLPSSGSDAWTVSAPPARRGVPACQVPNAVKLFGRGAEVARLAELLTAAGDPVWAVQGLPGAGKTDLLRAVGCAPRVVEHFGGGVLYAELGQEADAGEILRRWCAALGLKLPASDSPAGLAEIIRSRLAERPALLVLDDVWESTIATAQLLADCRAPGCAMLLSTRSPDVAGALAGSPARSHRLPMLADVPAVELLREHAPHAVAADPDGAADLAASLGNLPLALKLAGHLVERDDAPRPCLQLLGTWRLRLTELRGRERRPNLASGELSLDAIISLSYDAMPDDDTRAAAASLSVLGAAPLDFDRVAIEVAWDVEPGRAGAWIAAFVTSGLLERNPSTRRYSLHQTVHAFLEERCRAWKMSSA